MAEGNLVEDLHDAVLRLHMDIDDLEVRFRTVCGAYARGEARCARDYGNARRELQRLQENQACFKRSIGEMARVICELHVKFEYLRSHGYVPSNRPGQRRRRSLQTQWYDSQPWVAAAFGLGQEHTNWEAWNQHSDWQRTSKIFVWNSEVSAFVPVCAEDVSFNGFSSSPTAPGTSAD
jgi:hypothetical protein